MKLSIIIIIISLLFHSSLLLVYQHTSYIHIHTYNTSKEEKEERRETLIVDMISNYNKNITINTILVILHSNLNNLISEKLR